MPRENTSNQIRNLIPYLLNNYPYYYSEYSQTQKITIIRKNTEYHWFYLKFNQIGKA